MQNELEEEKRIVIQFDFSESGYARLQELVKKGNHISIADCVITALKKYEELLNANS